MFVGVLGWVELSWFVSCHVSCAVLLFCCEVDKAEWTESLRSKHESGWGEVEWRLLQVQSSSDQIEAPMTTQSGKHDARSAVASALQEPLRYVPKNRSVPSGCCLLFRPSAVVSRSLELRMIMVMKSWVLWVSRLLRACLGLVVSGAGAVALAVAVGRSSKTRKKLLALVPGNSGNLWQVRYPSIFQRCWNVQAIPVKLRAQWVRIEAQLEVPCCFSLERIRQAC